MLDISFHAATFVVRVLWGEFLCDWMQESGLLQLQVPESKLESEQEGLFLCSEERLEGIHWLANIMELSNSALIISNVTCC